MDIVQNFNEQPLLLNTFKLTWAFLIKMCPFSIVVVVVFVVVKFSYFHILLQHHWANFKVTHKTSLGEGDSGLFNLRATPFSKGYNYEILKILGQNFKIFFSKTTGPISTKFNTKHPWVTGIIVCLNEKPCHCTRRDNYEIAKIHWQYPKSSSPELLGLFQPNLAQSIIKLTRFNCLNY